MPEEEKQKPKVHIEAAAPLTVEGIKEVCKEEKKEKKKFPANFLVDVFADQQLITLDKSKNQKEEKK